LGERSDDEEEAAVGKGSAHFLAIGLGESGPAAGLGAEEADGTVARGLDGHGVGGEGAEERSAMLGLGRFQGVADFADGRVVDGEGDIAMSALRLEEDAPGGLRTGFDGRHLATIRRGAEFGQ